MILLDAFCGAGGAGAGYKRAGFEVIGVDLKPQPRYPFEFHQADALEVLLELAEEGEVFGHSIAAVHASPPCQAYSALRVTRPDLEHPELVEPTRRLLQASGLPYVIENVPGAPLAAAVVLCGSMFGLGSGKRQLRRHRLFECSFPVMSPPCHHVGQAIGVYGGGDSAFSRAASKRRGGYQGSKAEKAEAMGIDWMTREELNQAIPPAYTEHLGFYLRGALQT